MKRLLTAILYGVFFAGVAVAVRATFDTDDLIIVATWAGAGGMAGFWTAKGR